MEDNNLNDIIGYCKSCKDPVFLENDYVKNNGTLWCITCYEVEHDIIEELNFDDQNSMD